eukprot:SAG11_NODE_1229_length_5462_cov_12.053888_1_plen_65_part_10
MTSLLLLPLAMAQLFPPPFGNSTCDMSTLQGRTQQADIACGSAVCSADCVPELLPLAKDCADIIN